MIEIVYATLVCILSYFIGCQSMAAFLAKSTHNLNIYKVGTGMADTENIFTNVGEFLGVICGLLDFSKMAGYLLLLMYLFGERGLNLTTLATPTMIFLFGMFMIAGHCLPITNKLKGGRGIFSYLGLTVVFIHWHTLAIFIIAVILVKVFKQIRFAQYFIVLTPPIACFFMEGNTLLRLMTITAVLMGIFNVIVSKKYGEL